MERLLNRAFDALRTLPEVEQERIAWEIIKRVEDKTEWDRLVASPASQAWLKQAAQAALKDYNKVARKLSLTFLAMPGAGMTRKEAYWAHFDNLPPDIRKLAEDNYRLWQQDSKHPSLRFKQIHGHLPVFSYRVAMQYRTIGVQTDDGKLVWFWVGSFDDFRQQVGG